MQGKSNAFLQVTPFIPRSGILASTYIAFPLDIIGTPQAPFGCLMIDPASNFNSSGNEGGEFAPLQKIYTIFNTGGAEMEWSVSASETWVSFDVESGTIPVGGSVQVTVTLDEEALDEFFTGTETAVISFVNESNGCGDIDVNVNVSVSGEFPLQTIIFDQYDGPFEYPAWLPQYGFRYYLNEDISGTTKWKYAPVGGSVGSRPCDTTTPPNPAYGVITTTYSGSVEYNTANPSVVGSLQTSAYQDGTVTAYDNNVGKTTVNNYSSLSGLLSSAAPAAEKYSENATPDSISRRWVSTTNQTGWFPGSVGGVFDSIYCPGTSVSANSSTMVTVEDLGIALARTGGTGSAAQTQTNGDFNTTTRINEGNFSRARISVAVDPARQNLTGTYVFLVTPTVGTPYSVTVIKDFPILGNSVVNSSVDFPQIPNSTVFMESWSYSYQKILSESFEVFDEDIQIVSLAATESWPEQISYGAPPPNECCWDDFESYPTDVIQDGIYQNITGERWNGPGLYSAVSYTEFFDDFEGYAIGETNLFAQGAGWTSAGSSAIVAYGYFWDDFESYPVGSIFTFTYTTADMLWNGDGHSA